ncbi:unnamed protein product [Didymodactylos carnosus]|uniref:Uncharacterized protein n=1 Tax=Didymodactylos carnosus TaxID=1234261 RepID=A0A8S2DKA2_9BILA|nr:unnamed protein product [Didymodactylos carnosus]CAF3721931.1 unnamed protein product [Didymodactylos carnosus]
MAIRQHPTSETVAARRDILHKQLCNLLADVPTTMSSGPKLTKLDFLKHYALTEKPHIIAGVETWLGPLDEDNTLAIDGYSTLYRNDRTSHGGQGGSMQSSV